MIRSWYMPRPVRTCTALWVTLRNRGARWVSPSTPRRPLTAVEEVLPDLDIVLVMTVNPGFGGQSFIPAALGKLRRLYRTISDNGYGVQLEVDGGVKADDTARDSVAAGAGILVAGTAIFNREQSVAEAMAALRDTVSGMSPGSGMSLGNE